MAAEGPWNLETARLQLQGLTRNLATHIAGETGRRLPEDRLNEAFTSQTFVLPLLGALGWETRNSPTLEVFPESRVGRKRADFRVRLGGVDRFYVEVKALDKDLDDGDPETGGFRGQAINYSWTKGLNWAVLTNFKRTILLRTWLATNDPDAAVEWDITSDRYDSEFHLLAALSKQAVGEHRLENTALRAGRGPRKKRIDRQLFEDLTDLRERLSRDISRRNQTSVRDESELDEAVQRLLDRLVFIRVTEDREMESPVLLPILREESGQSVLDRLRTKFRDFDTLYDSRLFQSRATGYDPQLVDRLDIGDDILRETIMRLHWSEGGIIRYDFAAMDADVLGMMYEQYLGMLLRKTAKGASLRDGTVQRNERGVFYTPTWIVDYVVKVTLDAALQRKGSTPEALRVLDLACGSGSFLIRAFDEMRRLRNPSGGAVQSRFDAEVERLPYAVRVAILKENLFGVDLDPKAVEIAQLNLMIRALERRQKIPALDRNVISRDSLIEDSSVSPRGRPWKEMFPAIMAEGGFDAIVGNPPYVPFQSLSDLEEGYFRNNFSTARDARGNYDIYVLFVEKALDILKEGGVAGFILPNKFLNAEYGRGLRRLLAEKKAIFRLLDFRDYQVFDGVTTYTCLLFIRKSRSSKMTYGRLRPGTDPGTSRMLRDEDFERFDARIPSDAEKPWNFILPEDEALFRKLEKIPRKLGDVAEAIYQGLKTGNDKVFFVHRLRDEGDVSVVRNALSPEEHRIESTLLRPLLKGREARRWGVSWGRRYLVYPYEVVAGKIRLIPLAEVQRRFPAAYEYFQRHAPELKGRDRGALGRKPDWHQFSRLQNMERFPRPKILVQEEADHNRFSFDRGGIHFVRCYGIVLKSDAEEDYFYALGVLNSRPVEFYHHLISTPYEGGFFDYRSQFVTQLPLPEGSPQDRREIAAVARAATEKFASLSGHSEGTDAYRDIIRETAELEKELDRLAISLFNITDSDATRLSPLNYGLEEASGVDSEEPEQVSRAH